MAEEEDEDQLEVKGLIGEGAFGKVFLLEDKQGSQFALKVVQIIGRHPKEIMQTLQEVKLLAELEHESILKYVEASQQGTDLWIVTEYCPNGDIGGYIKGNRGTPMEETRLLLWIRQISDALQYLHNHDPKVIHRDLKNDNIFLDANWDAKLGDFGIARILEGPSVLAQTQCGTPLYMSPEIFAGIPYTEKTDIYSLGVMMYEMCHMDKDNVHPQILLYKIVQETPPNMSTGYQDGIAELMSSMMSKNPHDRPSAQQILDNPVFQGVEQPPPIESDGNGPDVEDIEDEEEMLTILGTLSQLDLGGSMKAGGAAALRMSLIPEEDPSDEDTGIYLSSDDYEANPIMGLVYRTLTGMGKSTVKMGESMMQQQVEMLQMYCLQCLNNNHGLFEKASKALDPEMDEDELEELLIRILGHERYAMCGAELLYYKNFTFNMRQK